MSRTQSFKIFLGTQPTLHGMEKVLIHKNVYVSVLFVTR